MSTKTLRKRIALVAVSAMGFGLLTSVAANASSSDLVRSSASSGKGYDASTSFLACSALVNDSSDANQLGEYLVGGTAKFTYGAAPSTGDTTGDKMVVALSGPAAFSGVGTAGTATVAYTNGGATLNMVASSAAAQTGVADFTVKFTAAGTAQIAISSVNAGTTTDVELYTITVSTSCNSGTPNVTNSFVKVSYYSNSASSSVPSSNVTDSTAAVTTAGSASLAESAAKIANGGKAYIDVRIMDGKATPAIVTSAGAFGATATNGAVVSWSGSDSLQSSSDSEIVAAGNQFNRLTVWQGTANKDKPLTTTVTITYNGVVYGVRTITFTGKATKLSISAADSSIAAAGTTAKYALAYAITDAAGNDLTNSGPGITGASSSGETNSALLATSGVVVDATQAIVTSIPTINTEASGYYGTANVTCGSGSGSAKVYLKYVFSDLSSLVSDQYDMPCAYGAVNYKASLDKSSYQPGEIATLTITATDKNGKPVYDLDATPAGNALGSTSKPVSISLPQMTAVTAPSNVDEFVGGKKTYKYTVGTTEGSFAGVVDLPLYNGTTYSQVAQTVSYKVASGSTAITNAEVLAAIVKLIASINKQIAALQKALTKKK